MIGYALGVAAVVFLVFIPLLFVMDKLHKKQLAGVQRRHRINNGEQNET
jgi:hypothetical protein